VKQDLLAVVQQGTLPYNAIDGNEVVNFAKLNAITLKIVTNEVGEITLSTTVTGNIQSDERLSDGLEELPLPMNEIFNDYNNNIVGSPESVIIGGSGNHVEGINNNVWSDFTSQADHIEGQDHLFMSNIRFMLGGGIINSSVDAESAGITNWSVVKTNGVHIEGYENYSLYSDTNHIEGSKNVSMGADYSHNEGYKNLAFGKYSHIEGYSDNDIITQLGLLKDYVRDLGTIQPKFDDIISNANDLNKPSYNTILEANPFTLAANKVVDLKSAIANEYLSYNHTHDVYSKFFISPNSIGSAFGDASHTEGSNNTSFADSSHSEGTYTTTSADYSHSEGLYSHAFNKGAHVEGGYNIAGSFVILDSEGKDVTRKNADGDSSVVSYLSHQVTELTNFTNNNTTRLIFDKASFANADGEYDLTPTHNNDFTIKTGFKYTGSGEGVIDRLTKSRSLSGTSFTGLFPTEDGVRGFQHAEGYNNLAFGDLTHAEGFRNWAITPGSHVEGVDNLTTYDYPISSNLQLDYLGLHVEGSSNVVRSAGSIHVEGSENLVEGNYYLDNNITKSIKIEGAHIEGYQNILGIEPSSNSTNGIGTHIEGRFNMASGNASHTEGSYYKLRHYVAYNETTGNPYLVIEEASILGVGNYTYLDPNTSKKYNWGPKTYWTSIVPIRKVIVPNGAEVIDTDYLYLNNNKGESSHVEGGGNTLLGGIYCHVEGSPYTYLTSITHNEYTDLDAHNYTTEFHSVSGSALHVEGRANTCYGIASHVEGDRNNLSGLYGLHGEGYNNTCMGNVNYVHAEGIKTKIQGGSTYHNNAHGAHTEGYGSRAMSFAAHAEGSAINKLDTENSKNIIVGIADENSVAGNIYVNYSGSGLKLRELINNLNDSAEKDNMSMYYNIPEDTWMPPTVGTYVLAAGIGSHAEGGATRALGHVSHTEGLLTETSNAKNDGIADNVAAHAEGICTYAFQTASHTEGINTKVTGVAGHAEGVNSIVEGIAGHAEGYDTQAIGQSSHAEGTGTLARGMNSHAGGTYSSAYNDFSFVHGSSLITDYNNQFVIGRFNKLKEYGEAAPDRLFMVGNGVDIDHRSNALVLDINGKLTINDVAFGTIDSLADEIARIWAAIGGGGGGGATSLAGLSDVHLTNPINGQALIFDSGSGRWINGDAGGGGGGVEVDIARQMESNMTDGSELPIEIGTMEEQVEEQEESE